MVSSAIYRSKLGCFSVAKFKKFRFFIFRFVSLYFVSFLHFSFRFVVFRFVSSFFVSFRCISFRFISFRFRFSVMHQYSKYSKYILNSFKHVSVSGADPLQRVYWMWENGLQSPASKSWFFRSVDTFKFLRNF
jgi:hypothetical protein